MDSNRTIAAALRNAVTARREHEYVFQDLGGAEVRFTHAELAERVGARASHLLSSGVRKGDVTALVELEPQAFVERFFALLQVGAIAVPIYPPVGVGSRDSYEQYVRGILSVSRAKYVSVSERFRERFARFAGASGPKLLEIGFGSAPARVDDGEVGENDVAFLQFTSGSTGAPKGVAVTHGSLLANAQAVAKALALEPGRDVGVSWLPLYHDMGLIGFVVGPLVTGVSVVLIPTTLFARSPHVWLDAVHRHRGTVTFAPNFAYGLIGTRTSPQQRSQWDLSCLRVAGCGAEPISVATLQRFHEAFAPSGVRWTALTPAYGLAEATLAVAVKPSGTPLRTHPAAARFGTAATQVVSCGRPLPRHDVQIWDERDACVPEGREGQIVVRGPSCTQGYWNAPEANRRLIQDGWLKTGDLGFLSEGELYVTGRMKDLLIVRGRNLHPQSIEAEAAAAGARSFAAVAFAVPSEEGEAVVVALESTAEEPAVLAAAVRARVQPAFGIALADIVILRPGSLPRTTSGKLQRNRARELYLAGALASRAGKSGSRRAAESSAE